MINNKPNDKKDKKEETFVKLYPKVLAHPKLTLLKKIILCDVISFQRKKGGIYYKTSNALADELGNYNYKTIQNNFQQLERDGFISTKPYKVGNHENELRQVEVIQIEKWIYTDEHLASIRYTVLPLVKKDNSQISDWRTQRAKAKKKTEAEALQKTLTVTSDVNTTSTVEVTKEVLQAEDTKPAVKIKQPSTPLPIAEVVEQPTLTEKKAEMGNNELPIGFKSSIERNPSDTDESYNSRVKYYSSFAEVAGMNNPTAKDFEKFCRGLQSCVSIDEKYVQIIWNGLDKPEQTRVSPKILAGVRKFMVA